MSWDSDEPEARHGRRRKFLLGFSGVVVLSFLAGPRVPVEERWIEPDLGGDVEAYLRSAEQDVPGLRPEAAKAIEWANPEERAATDWAIVYLHGFSADRHEIDPVVSDVADSLGANVFYTRLTGHGRDGAAMAEATVADWFDDAAEAIAVGRRLGDRVLVMGTSTGGTLALWTAAREEATASLGGLVLMSPNFHPVDRTSRVLLWPWGSRIAGAVVGEERCWEPANEAQGRHWTTCYPTAALPPMMGLVEHVREMDLAEIRVPTLVLYSRLDEVVDPFETAAAIPELGSEMVSLVEIDSDGDPSHHVLAGDILSPEKTAPTVGMIVDFVRSIPGGGPGGRP